MAKLTSQQIEAMVQEAQTLGLTASEADALREVLLHRTVDFVPGERLALTMAQLDKLERDAAAAFMDASAAIRDGVMAQGRAGLGDISDDEWAALIAPDEAENDSV